MTGRFEFFFAARDRATQFSFPLLLAIQLQEGEGPLLDQPLHPGGDAGVNHPLLQQRGKIRLLLFKVEHAALSFLRGRLLPQLQFAGLNRQLTPFRLASGWQDW